MKKILLILLVSFFIISCKQAKKGPLLDAQTSEKLILDKPFVWEGANIYFLLTDRFKNGDTTNDLNFNRTEEPSPLRGFMGGDIKGITAKINEGYFTDLGINAIWFTPVVEQIHGATDEGTGNTYGYHGYWTKDWTALDPNFGTKNDLEEMVKTAHKYGIRILMDVVLNHTGPVTPIDPVWPSDWVRTAPACTYSDYKSTTACTLVANLPDIKTESDAEVELPEHLLAKWKKEGRLTSELDELEQFFENSGYTKTSRAYIIKWLTDYVHDLGIDGFRVDTVKHADETAWSELYTQASIAFNLWKKNNPDDVLDTQDFYMMGEVYNYGISGGRTFDFGDKKVDYYDHGFKSLLNFELKYDTKSDYETIFTKYDDLLHTSLEGKSVVNYLTSHDDGSPFDKERKKPYYSANVLLLTPGASQVYYGDESARSLEIAGTKGDATLRSFMNWEEIDSLPETRKILEHWQKLGQFRANHPAVGAGKHKMLTESPYVFQRTYINGTIEDRVVIGLNLPKGKKTLSVKDFFSDGTKLFDSYSKTSLEVRDGKVILDSDFDIALLEIQS
ncbi:alpha-amylase family glycosyl hydrolase [Cellulophaga sp. Hel_I_12]|uniref:alpha-amylase family glycosyl hydrolase n=1 Tax=Cellulophaga sp. Hel_I_12 TaxID=1249972 RepID=UPI000646EA70|nr:alpha-amylase family glycosyl hydrolase [Cellulophaga sp. Hel_I_12]